MTVFDDLKSLFGKVPNIDPAEVDKVVGDLKAHVEGAVADVSAKADSALSAANNVAASVTNELADWHASVDAEAASAAEAAGKPYHPTDAVFRAATQVDNVPSNVQASASTLADLTSVLGNLTPADRAILAQALSQGQPVEAAA